jgi:hypothetical protein
MDLDRGQLTADLGGDTHLGRTHDANDRRRSFWARQQIGADADYDQN